MTNARAAKTAREKAAELRAEQAKAERRKNGAVIAAAALVVIGIIVGIGVIVQNGRAQEKAKGAPPSNLNATGQFVVGDAAAPVTVTLFEDFQCPACAEFEGTVGAQLATWVADKKVQLHYHPVAFLDRASLDEYSTRSAVAAAAVINSSPTAFQKYHDLLYKNQPAEGGPGLTNDKLAELATQAGADGAAVTTALKKELYRGWAAKSTQEAFEGKYKITGTPAVLVNGKEVKVNVADPVAVLTAAVEAAAK